ncbi:MAG: hypothetical protein DPW14_11175 [Planctomycetes bacterium]|nr:hypothetical protein [Planctomycetota bacterium]
MVYQSVAGANSDSAGTFTSNYDANGNVSTSVDARGYSTSYTYDGFDRTMRVDDPAGHYRTTTYDANSNALYSRAYSSAGVLLAESLRSYDEIDRAYQTAVTAKDHEGNNIGDGLATSTVLFDKNSRVTSSTDDNGVTFYRFYDAASRVSSTRDAVGNETSNVYNSDGAVTKTNFYEINGLTNTLEKSHVEYDLDKMNRKIAFRDQRYASGTFDTQIDYAYDSASQLVTLTDAAGTETSYTYDLLGRALQTTRKPTATAATWIVTLNTWDKDSRLTKQQISKNPDTNTSWQTTEYMYDERSRRITTRRADGDVWTYKYDENGNMKEWLDPLGTRVTHVYDSRNLLTTRNIARASGIKGATYEVYAYDGLGRPTSCSNYDGSSQISATSCDYDTLSLKERCTLTVTNSEGTIMGTYATEARYDANGFNTATIFSNDREVQHTPDQLNRLLESYDITNGISIAAYAYAGNRLIQRVYGNGTRSEYTYQAAGCGCGGFASYIENIDHTVCSNDELLFNCSRRFGVTGVLTSERRGHEGARGTVLRYDNAYRLTSTYYGVDLYDNSGPDDHATFGDPGNTPTTFALKRAYGLDQFGNRTGSSGTHDTDDSGSPVTIWDTNYTVSSDDMNLYSSVGHSYGTASYSYDAIEQMTQDGSRGLYYTYDYAGRQISHDTNSNSSTPERIFSYDCHGNRVTEQLFYDDGIGGVVRVETVVLVYNCARSGGCGGGGDDNLAEEIHYNSSPSITGRVQYDYGKGSGMSLVHELATQGANTEHRFRHENQDGNLLGMTDLSGYRLAEYAYQDYGTPLLRKVLFDGQDSRISSVAYDTPSSGYTTITLTSSVLTADQLNGRELVISRPTSAGDRYITATINDTTTSTIVVIDAGGASAPVYAALNGTSQGFVVFDFNDAAIPGAAGYSTGGKWTSSPSYGAGSDQTTWTDSGATFVSNMIGNIIEVDAEFPQYTLNVVAIGSIKTKGDATTLGSNGSRYRVYYSPGVNPTTGALYLDVIKDGSRYLYGSMRYLPPQAGVYVDTDILGADGGYNESGNYFTGSNEYDPSNAAFQNKPNKAEKPDPNGDTSDMARPANPWGDLTEKDPDPAGTSSCDGTATPKSYTWEINGVEVNDTNANWNPNPAGQRSGRSSWDTSAGDLQVHYKVDVQITGKEDPNKWTTCTLTCKAEGNYTYISSANVTKDEWTYTWNQGVKAPTKYYDDKGKEIQYKLDEDDKISDEEWTTYHRFPCVEKVYDLYHTMRKSEVSRVWDPATKQFKKTTHGNVYQCTLKCPGGGLLGLTTEKARAYDPNLPHAAKQTTTGSTK